VAKRAGRSAGGQLRLAEPRVAHRWACRSRPFPPAAGLVSLIFIYTVNRTIPGSAVLSIWPPHAILFCFLFFLASCASLARELPPGTGRRC
jgi:hypothetical protein